MSGRELLSFFLTTLFLGSVIGGFSTEGFDDYRTSLLVNNPIELTSAERASKKPLIQPLVPMTITLHILSHKEFLANRGDKYTYAWEQDGTDGPCEIFFEEGKLISFIPSDLRSAKWVDDWDGITMAHEILHCIRGDWHRKYDPKRDG